MFLSNSTRSSLLVVNYFLSILLWSLLISFSIVSAAVMIVGFSFIRLFLCNLR